MNRLFAIGFQVVGNWRITGEELKYELRKEIIQENVLYAFTSNSQLLYIGKTTKTLRHRMDGYLRPTTTQKTNLRNHKNILSLLNQKYEVEILAMPDNELHRYGAFNLNYPAALEDSIIKVMKPKWNGQRTDSNLELTEESSSTKTASKASLEDTAIPKICSFKFILGKTYMENGFFNVPKSKEHHFGEYKTEIDIFCGNEKLHIKGRISRSHPEGGTPRIRGFDGLRNWFISSHSESDTISVDVIDSSTIQIH